MGSCLSSVTRYNININMKFLVVVCALASMCLADSEADADADAAPQFGLHGVHNLAGAPYLGFPNALPAVAPAAGAVSSTNVNVPGQFSYVVNSVHPTRPETIAQAAPLPLATTTDEEGAAVTDTKLVQLPLYNAGYGGYAGLGYAGYNPWFGAGYGYGYGLNGLNSPYGYGRFGGLAHGYAGYPYYG